MSPPRLERSENDPCLVFDASGSIADDPLLLQAAVSAVQLQNLLLAVILVLIALLLVKP